MAAAVAGLRASSSSFVTTPIFYVNAAPHIGHLYSMVLADVAHRYALLRGRPSIMCTGTDEHGTKVSRAAQSAGIAPQPFVDTLSSDFKRLADAARIDYCRFVRTTDDDHMVRASALWTRLRDSGMIYKSTHGGWYCVSDETFYPEQELITNEETGAKTSRESGNAVEWYEEENYFFKLSKMRPALIDLYRNQNKQFVLPSARHDALLAELESTPLPDLSISRPVERCSWGIPVPSETGVMDGSSGHTMYVWFEALVNYLTVAESEAKRTSSSWWPPTNIIGKDIMRFHAVYWPAFLLAAGIDPPQHVIVHSHWLIEGSKMSKSKQNVVEPFQLMERFGVDTVRYALCYDSMLAHDSPFSEDRVVERHNVNLVNKWVNLASRVCGPKFNLNAALTALDNQSDTAKQIAILRDTVDTRAQQFEFGKYARALNDFAITANGKLEQAAPWLQPNSPESYRAIGEAAECCRVLSILLLPITPQYASNMLDRLGVRIDRRSFAHATFGADLDYGTGANRKGDHVLQRILL